MTRVPAITAIATRFRVGAGRSGFGRLRTEEAFQPADEAAGFFLRLGLRLRCAFLIRLIRARFEATLIAPLLLTTLARFERTALTAFTSTFTTLATFAAFTAFATFATFAPLARLERAALFTALRRLLARRARGRVPMHCRALRRLGREDFQLGLAGGFRGGGTRRQTVWLRGVSGGTARGTRGRVERRRRFRNGRGADGRAFLASGDGRQGSGLRSRLVGARRGDGGFSRERIFVFARRGDDFDGAGFVTGGRGGWLGCRGAWHGTLAAREAGTASGAERADR
jgi:hypothetical protein